MMDFQTFFVYFTLILVMLVFAKISAHSAKIRRIKITHYSFVIPILFFTSVVGLRYMVGVDYGTYLDLIKNTTSDYYFHSIEPVYQYLILFIEKNSLHFSYFFIISAFLQIVFFYKSFDRPLLFLLPWAVPMFIMAEIGPLQNVVRHYTAIMIFFYALNHIKNQKLVYYAITIFIASLFHRSILVCLPLYFLGGRELVKSAYLRFGLVLFFLIASAFLRNALLSISGQLIIMLGYAHHLKTNVFEKTGLGIYLIWIVNFIIIGYYPKLKEAYRKNGFMIYWNLFYIGLLVKPMLDYIIALSRMNWYFYKLRFLILAFLLHYLYQHRNDQVHFLFFFIVLCCVVVIFIYSIMVGNDQMAPYYFIWDHYY